MPMGRIVRVAPRSNKRGLNYKQVKQVQKIVNSNKSLKTKRLSVQQSPTSAGTLTEITGVSEGDDYNQRNSDRINALSIKMALTLSHDTTNTGRVSSRVVIARSKVGPLALGDFTLSATAQQDLDKMQILYDRCFQTDPDAPVVNDILHYKSFKNRKVPHMVVGYDDDASATAAQNNPIYLLTYSSDASDGPAFQGYIDFKFMSRN